MTHFFQPARKALFAFCTLATLSAAQPQPEPKRVRPVLTHTLPPLQGGRLQATMLEVNYGPGESSSAHSHPCPVLVYVVSGAIRTQVQGEPEAVFQAGEGFYEAPNGVHAISANASKTAPAKFVAYFLCDHDTPLSTDVPQAQTPRPPHPPAPRTATGKERATDQRPAKPKESTTNPDRQGGVPRCEPRTSVSGPWTALSAPSTERTTDLRPSSPNQNSVPSPTQPRSASDGLPSASRTPSTPAAQHTGTPQ